MEGVAKMRINMTISSMLPSAVCTPSVPATSALLAANALLAAKRPVAEQSWMPQAHSVQSELGKAVLVLVDGNKGTTGFSGNGSATRKRYTDGGSGVPPRGRPV
jgi:hypothetical protein